MKVMLLGEVLIKKKSLQLDQYLTNSLDFALDSKVVN